MSQSSGRQFSCICRRRTAGSKVQPVSAERGRRAATLRSDVGQIGDCNRMETDKERIVRAVVDSIIGERSNCSSHQGAVWSKKRRARGGIFRQGRPRSSGLNLSAATHPNDCSSQSERSPQAPREDTLARDMLLLMGSLTFLELPAQSNRFDPLLPAADTVARRCPVDVARRFQRRSDGRQGRGSCWA